MRADSTMPGEVDGSGPGDDGILAAIVFVIVSVLLIATLPLPAERGAGTGPHGPAPAATSRGGR
jgi:hypothetical protein